MPLWSETCKMCVLWTPVGLSEYNSFSSPRNLLSEMFSVRALPPDHLLLNSQNKKYFTNCLRERVSRTQSALQQTAVDRKVIEQELDRSRLLGVGSTALES
jgi:hypothetical protein